MLPATALAASAAATHERLGGPGSWLLADAAAPHRRRAGAAALPGRRHRARVRGPGRGLQQPAPSPRRPPPGRRPGDRRYTALVPTQLVRLLADAAATDGARRVRRRPRRWRRQPTGAARPRPGCGVRVVTTYGMSETCGGCVYDGVPLAGTDDPRRRRRPAAPRRRHPRQRLPRPPGPDAAAFSTDEDGRRWFRTDDVGHQDETGRWHVDGRLDDLITTGGLKVAPRLVEEALTALPDVAEAVVVGTPDEEWGQVVSAALVLEPRRAGPAHPRWSDAARRAARHTPDARAASTAPRRSPRSRCAGRASRTAGRSRDLFAGGA